ncbi:TonB-dependent receptor plug domain-containing protein [Dyadobacter flavalbus]|uniref:TonB-dependent receptor plug domain-containing protein n=1 Tax=Dyadobacter flavalbus TaxID=2579942 RepID=A0A5M8QVB7_9BACT|nr:TonB-dependent receptor [Dyadobacter flavalbus]KAA6438764.1 TonB-dependent receptor plug domain-containing protein [Dyadobacter flavalbus]
MNLKITSFLLFLFSTSLAFAQTGSIKGNIVDYKSKEAVIGASIVLKGSTPPIGTATDVEGNFDIQNIPTGKQTVIVSYVSYKPKEIAVEVYPNQAVLINTTIEEDVANLEEVKIVGQRQSFTDVSVITEIKQAEQIAVGISAQQIQRSQDRDASQVVRRVPGISIQDDRFVIIRGLNERYNTVMLNDAITPSTEVDVKSFSFDLIPSTAIDRMMIYKSGAPELPGEFAGGIIKIYTKTIPDDNGFTFSLTGGYRGNTTFKNVRDYNGSSLDWTGFGASDRALPNGFPSTRRLQSENSPSDASLNAFRNLPEFFDLKSKSVTPDLRASLGFNHKFELGNMKLTTFNNVNYSSSHQFLPTTQFRYLSFNTEKQKSDIQSYYQDELYQNNVRLGVMSNWALIINPNHKIEFRNLFNQLSNKETNFRQGYNTDNDTEVQNYAFRYESKSIYSGQLGGTHELGARTTVKWLGALGTTFRSEPDYRRFISSRAIGTNGPFRVELVPGSNASLTRGARFYSELTEYTSSFRADIEHRIQRNGYEDDESMQIKLRAGAYGEMKDRAFKARWFNLTNSGSASQELLNQAPGQLFDTQNIGLGKLYYAERTNTDDKYNAQNTLMAGYLGAYVPISKKFNASVGLRVENNIQKLQSRQRGGGERIRVNNPILRFLPSANFAYNFTEKSLVRLAYSVSVNRPEFRELAPFTYYDFNFDVSRVGNPNLKTPSIQNVDLRYEFYPKDGELISVAAFYKHFLNPIEARIRYAGSGISFYVDNAKSAYTAGGEIELRKSLKNLTVSPFVDNLSVLLNASVITSNVLTGFAGQENDRQLQGQSPYLINAGIYFNDVNRGWQVNALYNVVGRRIFLVGDKELQPTVYEMARNVIDLNVVKALGEHLEIKLGIQDLLNQRFRLIQDSNLDQKITNVDESYQSYRRGSYSQIGINYRF